MASSRSTAPAVTIVMILVAVLTGCSTNAPVSTSTSHGSTGLRGVAVPADRCLVTTAPIPANTPITSPLLTIKFCVDKPDTSPPAPTQGGSMVTTHQVSLANMPALVAALSEPDTSAPGTFMCYNIPIVCSTLMAVTVAGDWYAIHVPAGVCGPESDAIMAILAATGIRY
jgi:hypothetical protein